MPKIPHYDVVILGSGSAGFSAVEAARAEGASVCLIERDRLGGECPNYACIPSKALLKAAAAYREMRHARTFGVQCKGLDFDFSAVAGYRQSVVERITGGGERGNRFVEIAKRLGVEVAYGQATFVEEDTVEVDGAQIRGKAFVIATGTVDFVPPVPGLSDIRYLTWKDALQLTRQPKSLGIIGGGPVGCELATFFGSFETRVTLFQTAPTVLDREDGEIARLAHARLAALGVKAIGNAKVKEIINARGGVYGMKADVGGAEEMHAVEHVLLAAGKRAATDGLGLEEAGVLLDARGTIKTDAEQRTSAKHVFAAGDVDGGLQFTHTAHRKGSVAGHNAALAAGGKRKGWRKADLRVVPRVTFMDPEVASVGMTSEEAKEKYGKAFVGRFNVAGLGRAVTEDAREGLVKLVAHPKTRKILGCHILSPRAGEMVHEAALAIHLGVTADKLGSLVHAFPTYSEAVGAAANSLVME